MQVMQCCATIKNKSSINFNKQCSRKSLSNSRFCHQHSSQEEKNNSRISSVLNRESTMINAMVKDYINEKLEINQPKYTEQDEEKKMEIWGYKKGLSVFSQAKCNPNKGDHIYGIREAIQSNEIWGSDSKWNMIPCTHNENVSWKKINGKNLVYDEFTEEEFKMFSYEQKNNYTKLQNWKKYVESRAAKMYYTNAKIIDEKLFEIVRESLAIMNIKRIELQ